MNKVGETFTRIVTVRRRGGASIAFLRSPKDEKILVSRNSGNEWDAYMIHPESSLENDLNPGLDVRFFITAFSCDSDDSFLFSVPAMSLAGMEINGRVIGEEDNAVLVKYRIKSDYPYIEQKNVTRNGTLKSTTNPWKMETITYF